VDLRSSAFTHSQLYMALSRATLLNSISVLLTEDRDRKTNNIVYPEVLLP
jgi:hypothetical protein